LLSHSITPTTQHSQPNQQEGKAKDAAERAAALEAARKLQEELARQVAVRDAGVEKEHEEEIAYFHDEQVGRLGEGGW